MGSKPSKARRPISTRTKAVNIPIIPHDIIDEILDHLAADSGSRSLRACALVSKSWAQSCRRLIFHTAFATSRSMYNWFKIFLVPEESPACYIQDLRICIGGDGRAPEKFFEHTSCFTGVQTLHFFGYGILTSLRRPSFWKPPQSVTSLAVDTCVVTLTAQLPNLDGLSLSGSPIAVNGVSPGIGTVLRGRFNGKLILRGGYAGPDIMNMLLDIPSGLHFTEMRIYCPRDYLHLAVRLTEACGKTLTKLSHTATIHCKSYPSP